MALTDPRRIPSLDGLRTISIGLVIASHAARIFGSPTAYNIGDLGVRVFFVISGFLITGLLIKELDTNEKINLVRFYFRRTLRIFPPYYFLLLVFAALAIVGKLQISFAQFIPAITYTSNYFFPGDWNLDHAWSLAVEEQFYLIFPGLLVLLGKRRMELALVATILICPLLRFVDHSLFGDIQAIWLTKGFHANVDTLAIGCLLAIKRPYLHNNSSYRRLLDSRLLLLLPIAIFLVNSQVDYAGLNLGLLYSLNNILIAICIDWSVTHADNVAGKILNSRPFVFIGMMSYSIYLWQQPFLLYLGAVVDRFLHSGTSPNNFSFPYSLFAFAGLCLISYFVVEKYSLRLRKYCEGRFLNATSDTTATEQSPANPNPAAFAPSL